MILYFLIKEQQPQTFSIFSIVFFSELMPNLPNIKLFEISAVLDHYMNVGGIVNQHLLRMQHPLDVLAVNWWVIVVFTKKLKN